METESKAQITGETEHGPENGDMTTGPSLAELRKQLQKTDIKDLCDG